MREVYIVGAVRTPIGKYGGSLKTVPAHELGSLVIREVLNRTDVADSEVEEVVLGEVRSSTEASNISRYCALEAGLPYSVTGYTVNRLCASGMQAVCTARNSILLGDADCIIAGGTENMSRAPHYLRNERWGTGTLQLVDSNIEGGLADQPSSIFGCDLSMMKTAENVAERFHITREEQDRFACESQRRAAEAIREGFFKEEIVPVEVKQKHGSFLFSEDEFVRPGTTMETLGKLRPIVKPDGTVTAGNSCGRNDGASVLLLMSGEKVKELGVKPMARIVDIAYAGLDPEIMGYGPVYATGKIMERTGMTVDQFDLIELNEAFASQSIACIRDLKLDPAKVNINGGAIALGHPLGCTGPRLITTLLYNLRRTGGKYGLATLCIGGGQSMATVIERL